eukprot:TRINITY_DN2300_c5_g1_i1.p1 TRINITY_DN2300_c5_g1~~TRINITY_DN2300_c5_g1_i1.p1  ORF type:complete len:234 (-),score=24.90 TRINITY_DN2300_c5_g1_i1:54-755(-)
MLHFFFNSPQNTTTLPSSCNISTCCVWVIKMDVMVVFGVKQVILDKGFQGFFKSTQSLNSQSINQSITQSLTHSLLNHSITQSLNHKITQSLSQSVTQSHNPSVNQSLISLNSSIINHTMIQSFPFPSLQSPTHYLPPSPFPRYIISLPTTYMYTYHYFPRNTLTRGQQAFIFPFCAMINLLAFTLPLFGIGDDGIKPGVGGRPYIAVEPMVNFWASWSVSFSGVWILDTFFE